MSSTDSFFSEKKGLFRRLQLPAGEAGHPCLGTFHGALRGVSVLVVVPHCALQRAHLCFSESVEFVQSFFQPVS